MNLESFLETQQKIYQEIRNLRVLETGAKADPALQERRGGFFVSFMHANDIARNASNLSTKIAECVPSVEYKPAHIHTTLGRLTDGFGPCFYCNPNSGNDHALLVKLGNAVKEALKELRNTPCPEIIYTGYLTTRNSVIAIGTPNEWLTDFAETLADAGKKIGVEIIRPWGSHITLARFTEKITKKEIARLDWLLEKSAPLGVSMPVAVATGYTLRRPEEKFCQDLKETPGHFMVFKKFAMDFLNPTI